MERWSVRRSDVASETDNLIDPTVGNEQIEVKKAQPRGGRDAAPTGQQFPIATHSGPTPAQLNKFSGNAQPQFPQMGMGGMNFGGMGMPMGGMGGMGGGFDPQAMAVMYQKMMMNSEWLWVVVSDRQLMVCFSVMNPMGGGGMGMNMMGNNSECLQIRSSYSGYLMQMLL